MSEEQINELTRRRFLRNAGITVAGIAVASSGLGALLSGCAQEEVAGGNGNGNGQIALPQWPWPYAKLDLAKAEERGYLSYKEAG